MTLIQSLFYILSFITILSAILVISAKNPVHSILYLILTFFTITAHYVLLNAQFVAIVNIIVYAGAIMVLFLFVMMMLNLNVNKEPLKTNGVKLISIISGGLLLVVLVAALRSLDESGSITITDLNLGSVKNLGQILFTKFLFPFEAISLLLLSAMVGSVLLAKRENK